MGFIEIPLTQGKVTTIDAADAELISGFKWRAFQDNGKGSALWYATAWTRLGRSSRQRGVIRQRKLLYMHRVIIAAPEGIEVDHVDGDGLNNRRINLRLATALEQGRNRSKSQTWRGRQTTSKWKGVMWVPKDRRWAAKIRVNGGKYLKRYAMTEREAALIYNQLAQEHHGAFARLNQVEDE